MHVHHLIYIDTVIVCFYVLGLQRDSLYHISTPLGNVVNVNRRWRVLLNDYNNTDFDTFEDYGCTFDSTEGKV